MKRRTFVQSSALLTAPISFFTQSTKFDKTAKPTVMSGFIVSDAHIGWRGEDQPTIKEQEKNIDHIVKRFPNIDVTFDTGDIHHGYLNEKQRVIARSQWLNCISNKFNKTPFYYIPGNHELGKGFDDPEVVAGIVGNHVLRPYYSFDIKGIHFISLPQLLDTIYVTEETLNWLALDLQINSNKTTIILSHNSIKNTTFDNGETGYRAVTNSQDLMKIIRSHANVVAWFHGHNHHYQIVKQDEMLFVSNGRIGGFNPPTSWGAFGQGHLGGIYFEISKTELVVKCYSSSSQDFLENLGYPDLSFRHKINTSYNNLSSANHYYGHGKISDGVILNSKSHYLSTKNEELYYKFESTPINENSHFELETSYFFAGRTFDKVIGYSITPKETMFENVEFGLKLKPTANTPVTLIAPVTKDNESQGHIRGSYYRFSNEIDYNVQLKLDPINNKNSVILLIFEVFDEKYNILFSNQHQVTTNEEKRNIEHIFKPKLDESNTLDNRLYFRIKFVFENNHYPFIINNLLINPVSRNQDLQPVYLEVRSDQNNRYMLSDTRDVIQLEKQNSQFAKLKAKLQSNQMLSFLIKKPDVQWQVRNATATIANNQLIIKKNTNRFCNTSKIILVPFQKLQFYIYQLENIESAQITYFKAGLLIRFKPLKTSQPVIYLHSNRPAQYISGAKVLSYYNNEYKLSSLESSDVIELKY